MIGIFAACFRSVVIVELHQDRLSNSWILDVTLKKSLSILKLDNLKIVVISDKLKHILLEQGLEREVTVLHDGFDSPDVHAGVRQNKVRVVYTGMVSVERGFLEICELAKECPDLNFVVMGAKLEEADLYRGVANEYGLVNLKVFSKQDRRRVGLFQSNAAVLLALWGHDVPTMKYCSPLKLFEYMSAGQPILCHDFEVFHEVVPEHNSGIHLFEPGNSIAAVKGLRELLNNPESRRDAALLMDHAEQYSYSHRARKMVEMCG
ncbi:glycosyltransferase [Pseudomonadales bacterium]|nr:glycosyltransferase [Pseudomonadales bacterium]